MKVHQNAHQGTAAHTEVYRPNHQTRGCGSPLGGGGPEKIIRRDEDYASAPMESLPKGQVPEPNRRGGVTAVRGKHGPQFNEDVT